MPRRLLTYESLNARHTLAPRTWTDRVRTSAENSTSTAHTQELDNTLCLPVAMLLQMMPHQQSYTEIHDIQHNILTRGQDVAKEETHRWRWRNRQLVNKQSRFTKVFVWTTTSLHNATTNGVSAAKEDKDNKHPELLNRVVQLTKPNYLFTMFECLLSLLPVIAIVLSPPELHPAVPASRPRFGTTLIYRLGGL